MKLIISANLNFKRKGAQTAFPKEVHFFDLQDNIYGKSLRVEFCQFIRAERKFAHLAELQRQIEADIAAAKAFFTAVNNESRQ